MGPKRGEDAHFLLGVVDRMQCVGVGAVLPLSRHPNDTAVSRISLCHVGRCSLIATYPEVHEYREDRMSDRSGVLSSDEDRLAALGYKQELNRGWSGFSNFAI